MSESEILSVIQFYLDSTPLYYTISRFFAGFIFIVTFLAFICRILVIQKPISIVGTITVLLVMFFSGDYFLSDNRPNLGVYYGHELESKLKRDDINYDGCVFRNKDYKIAKQMGLDFYARMKAQEISDAIEGKNKSPDACGYKKKDTSI